MELRHHPHDRRFCVLIHGCLDAGNIVFQYDEASGRPICAKFIDFSSLTVSSPVIDVTYFLHRAVRPDLARQHHAALLQHYHRAHLEAVKSFGMHGFEMELETLLNEYQDKQDYGAMMGCREALCSSTDSYLVWSKALLATLHRLLLLTYSCS